MKNVKFYNWYIRVVKKSKRYKIYIVVDQFQNGFREYKHLRLKWI